MSENIFEHLKSFTFFKFYDNLFLSKYSNINVNKNIFISDFSRYSTIKIIKKINIFKLLKPDEVKHSLILKTILDPKGDHGCGDAFLNKFFDVFLKESMIRDDKDIWEVTAEKERYDIRIRSIDNKKIIIIENKSNWADDQENQIYRYWYNGIYMMQQKYEKIKEITTFSKIFYLIPSDYRQFSMQSITRPKEDRYKDCPEDTVPKEVIKIIYFNEHIDKWLGECITYIKEKDINNEFCYFLTQYREFWRL